MNYNVARITDAVVELNSVSSKISANDTIEFDLERRLDVLETAIDDLRSEVEDNIEFLHETEEHD